MKKVLVLLSAISLSACSSYDHNMKHDDTNTYHMDHMKVMTAYCFHQMDSNGDGVVSMKEYMNYQRSQFKEADTNHDGKLTLDEMNAHKMKEKREMKEWLKNHPDSLHNDTMQNSQPYDTAPDMNQEAY